MRKELISYSANMKPCMLIIASVLTVLLGSCTDDISDSEIFAGEEIVFRGRVVEDAGVTTRANTTVTDVDYAKFPDVDFYMYMEGLDKDGNEKSDIGRYWVQSSTQGMLWPKTNADKLKWFSRDEGHQFWSWTVPWVDRETYVPFEEPMTFEFKDTHIRDSENPEDYWDNGSCLEKFVGATNGKFSYNYDGIYVPIQYRHLVSKIELYTFAMVDNATGTTYNNLKGDFTILGLPHTATFYPRPQDGPDGKKRAPYVVAGDQLNGEGKYEYDIENGVSFAVQNLNPNHSTSSSAKPYDNFYICPEMDFNNLAFKIELYERIPDRESPTGYKWVLDTSHGNRGAYYGDFRNVVFSRGTTGSGYDDPENTTGNLKDSKILHAGEYMRLEVSINSQGVPTVKVSVSNWTTPTTEYTAEQHIQPGIYADGEAHDLIDLFDPAKNHTQEEKDEYFEYFGSGVVSGDPEDPNYFEGLEGKKIYRLYDDVTLYDQHFMMDSDYMLDGMGHVIDFGKDTSYSYKVSKNLRNVYLKAEYWYDTSRWYIIFIDEVGDIWKVDPETWVRTKTTYSLSKATYDPVSISCSSGSYSKPYN